MKTCEIHIRDPFVLVHNGKYYMYGTRGATCWDKADGFDVFVGEDLENWEGPFEVFHNDGTFWADKHYWAPEVHKYGGVFYMLASFKKDGICRGTQILKADAPTGPFLPHSDGPVTPPQWECLDGTLYIEKDRTPYMIFCHEWTQAQDGEVCSIELSKDLKSAIGEPRLLFKASSAPWVIEYPSAGSFVTDGPFMYRSKDGDLLMIWSSFGENGYAQAVARSDNGTLFGGWSHDTDLIFEKDGGHGMIFTGLDGQLYVSIHTPNKTPEERPRFFELRETERKLQLLY